MLLKFLLFDANAIWRQECELSRQLQEMKLGMAVVSETYLETTKEVISSKLSFLFYRSLSGQKMRN
jgi:hypothetical protein